MAKITEAAFWINLLKKVFKSILRENGFREEVDTNHLHVVPYENKWAIKKEGNVRCTSKHRKQETAIRRAKTLAKRYKSDVIIHRADGSIRDRLSFD